MNVTDFLMERNIEFELIQHRETHDAQRMAVTIHVPGREVAKTVLLRANGGYVYFVAVLPANKAVDFERASQMLGGSKLDLATEVEISQHCPDCEIGALPPFGSQYGMKTMVDESLTEDKKIVFEGNTHHEAIRMDFEDFHQIEQPLIGSFVRES
jgi:Ala-tRNA(Pro) deacylase